ncbi:MAG: hypothetical protein ACJAT2_000614 [Bacteriovoracaceae bacterium]|jgi:hypothetical protein
MNSKLAILTICTTLASCAGNYQRPESFESKMARFKSKSADINRVPDFQVSEAASFKTKRTRGPASVSKTNMKDLYTEHTNKKLYFLTLFTQYHNLSKFSGADTVQSVNICPSFHSILVDHKDKFEAEGYQKNQKVKINFDAVYKPEVLADSTKLSSYPELMLPVTKDSLHPNVSELISSNKEIKAKEAVEKAINVHLEKTLDELTELCDSGSSSNYYIYENLITHIKKQGFRPSPNNMKVLLKTSIFSNRALIKSFEKSASQSRGRTIASVATGPKDLYTETMTTRLGVEWSESYFDSMTSNR